MNSWQDSVANWQLNTGHFGIFSFRACKLLVVVENIEIHLWTYIRMYHESISKTNIWVFQLVGQSDMELPFRSSFYPLNILIVDSNLGPVKLNRKHLITAPPGLSKWYLPCLNSEAIFHHDYIKVKLNCFISIWKKLLKALTRYGSFTK